MKLLKLCVPLLLASAGVSAELKSIDFLTPGDGLITHDTVSGLYWLDLDYTSTGEDKNPEFSFSKVRQDTQTLGHPLFGFSHASVEQVHELFINAGLNVTDIGNYKPAAYLQTKNYLNITGVTEVNLGNIRQLGYTGSTCGETLSYRFKRCPLLETYRSKQLIAAVSVRTGEVLDAYAFLASKAVDASNTIDVKTGHFLVTHYNPTKLNDRR